MMRTIIAFTYLFMITFSMNAQVAVIRNCHQLKGSEFIFPILSIPNNVNASKRINDFLQMSLAERTMLKTSEEKLFDDVKYKMGANENFGTLESVDYEVTLNSQALISIRISGTTMAAYPDYFEEGYTFNAASGDIVLLEDLCTKDGLKNLQRLLTKQRLQLVKAHIRELSEDSSYYDLTKNDDLNEQFSNCINEYALNDFDVLKDTVYFSSPRCMPHAKEALDGDFSIKLPIKQLTPYLNSYGKTLLIDKTPVKEAYHLTNFRRPLYGSIDKFPIVMYFNQPFEDEVSGYYYYVNEGLKIDFWGKASKNHFSLTCHSDRNHMVDELIEGTFIKNEFKGEWKKKINGAKPLPLSVN